MPFRWMLVLLSAVLFAACTDKPILVPPGEDEEPKPRFLPLGVYEVTMTGIGTPEMQSSVTPLPPSSGVSASLSAVPAGIAIELVSPNTLIEGIRGQGGHRYISFLYRVRNLTGGPLKNVTLVPIQTASTIPGTPFVSVRRVDGTNLPDSVARKIVPTGATALGEDTRMKSVYPDVLQAYEEAEMLTISAPAGVSDIFPYGFIVRSLQAADLRTLPQGSGPNDWGGTSTFAYRVPLQPGDNAQDAFTITFHLMAVQDSETRMTESIEEAGDTAAVRRLRTHATKIAPSMVTVLNGSPRMDPAVANYPGQRQICGFRTAGGVHSPVTRINAPGPLAGFKIQKPGETMDACAPYFTTGTASRPATNVAFPVTVRAMDRYGNTLALPDTVRIQMAAGSPPFTASGPTPLVGGTAAMTMTFTDYGVAQASGVGRRVIGEPTAITVAGVTRIWTAGAGTTNWHTGGNWGLGAVPMSLDSVHIPAAPSGGSIFPLLASNVSIMGVTVENGATLSLSAFDLTAGANVATGTSGGINSTSGRLNLAGVARTVHGVVPLTRVIGTYSLTGNLTVSRRLEVNLGRLTNTSFRVQQNPF
jgi:hypothetical protein